MPETHSCSTNQNYKTQNTNKRFNRKQPFAQLPAVVFVIIIRCCIARHKIYPPDKGLSLPSVQQNLKAKKSILNPKHFCRIFLPKNLLKKQRVKAHIIPCPQKASTGIFQGIKRFCFVFTCRRFKSLCAASLFRAIFKQTYCSYLELWSFKYFSRVAIPPLMCRWALLVSSTDLTSV